MRPPTNRRAGWHPQSFFLLQKIDRLDEKLSREIKEVDLKLSARMDSLDEKLSARVDGLDQKLYSLDQKVSSRIKRVEEKLENMRLWAIGSVITLIAGLAGVIITLLERQAKP